MKRLLIFVAVTIVMFSARVAQANERNQAKPVLSNPAIAQSTAVATVASIPKSPPTAQVSGGSFGRKIFELVTDGIPASRSSRIKFNVSPTELGVTFTQQW